MLVFVDSIHYWIWRPTLLGKIKSCWSAVSVQTTDGCWLGTDLIQDQTQVICEGTCSAAGSVPVGLLATLRWKGKWSEANSCRSIIGQVPPQYAVWTVAELRQWSDQSLNMFYYQWVTKCGSGWWHRTGLCVWLTCLRKTKTTQSLCPIMDSCEFER